ncbi:MAG: imidazole glycerol phosphate synthase subunit HisH [Proteobacteria bacterium]|jgi:imidazole glycerol-phosphate synthase subunit HisH|nr:imidazole glycerol phosphate synthase subunit HisH [Pseudomonadota bacterium]MDA1300856.1 imidazole glycerol phosphate synthase subunit HisH [Pseudomonadota bacterium]
MVAIVDYDAGNLRSVQRACQHVGMKAGITSDPDEVRRADRLIFPGVGSAASAVGTLAERGLDEAILEFFRSGKPILGICLGLQIALEFTEEGNQHCLGIIPGACERFSFRDKALKVPHIGWNEVEIIKPHPVLGSVTSGDEFYFVHSYFAHVERSEHVYGRTTYGDQTFSSVIGRDNFFATQFHLEKSGEMGLKLLAGFMQWEGDQDAQ